MKIAVRGGHNYLATGAVGLIDEVVEDRKVKDSVIKYLRQLGHTVLDVTPGNMDRDSDLIYGVNKANNWGADLFISIHFNKAYSSYNGAIGTEAWVYSTTDNYNDEEYAQRIVNTLGSLGFKNRGVKTSTGLYELKSTTMPSVIVEVCFVEATEDVALYKKLGHDKIGQTIAEAISNKKIEAKVEYDMKKLVTYYGDADLFSAVMVAQKNQCPLMKVSDYKASGIKAEQVIQIGGKAEDTNRYVTFKNAAKLV
ncbi:MAG: N-acetylmuramoyl-L-alanine amidase [Clostridium sp.]|nr:N-acetylmuramoyl-L-alanine amidase [Clostridium sp.]